ncbi:hypothetical protein A4A49_31471 [Nicotiana attenuata]|uniref:Uncharacterized protein n=1 Tax=Nicotiana attenuata TaxID=49451 RepID=A0A314KJM0_NICAT|nr:hypothetical protein A4A49_31471 [Nicotiana attenuata]
MKSDLRQILNETRKLHGDIDAAITDGNIGQQQVAKTGNNRSLVNPVGNVSKVIKGQSKPTDDVPTTTALARLYKAVNDANSRHNRKGDTTASGARINIQEEVLNKENTGNNQQTVAGTGHVEESVKVPATVGSNLEVVVAMNATVDRAASRDVNIGNVAPVVSVEKPAGIKRVDQTTKEGEAIEVGALVKASAARDSTSARTDGLEDANVNLLDTGAADTVATMSQPVHKGQELEGLDVEEMQESDVQAVHN